MASQRAFIAFETPSEIRQAIGEIQRALRGPGVDVRWEQPSKFHVTIKFLGDVDEGNLPEVRSILASAVLKFTSFDVIYRGIGAFPNIRQPRVLWIGIEEVGTTLREMKVVLEDSLVKLGFEREERAFHPHVTLGRMKNPAGMRYLTPKLEKCIMEPRQTTIHEILLMRSVLHPEGSTYSLIEAMPLHR